ncbi:MAG: hypothetical protein JWM27_958 [Gemmatimonadetes bacterium]|nr:hypothetical protein [Gemmatimonadota bacterium]
MRRIRLSAAVVASALALAACDGGSTGPGSSTGSLSFHFAGSSAGDFSASGDLPRAGTTPAVQFVAAVRDSSGEEPIVALVGFQPTVGGRGHLVEFDMQDLRGERTLSLAESCYDQATLAGCAIALIGLNYDLSTSQSVAGEESYLSDAGTVHITNATATRLQGTFSGHATELELAHEITLTQGQFDVPFVPLGALGLNRLPAAGRISLSRLRR